MENNNNRNVNNNNNSSVVVSDDFNTLLRKTSKSYNNLFTDSDDNLTPIFQGNIQKLLAHESWQKPSSEWHKLFAKCSSSLEQVFLFCIIKQKKESNRKKEKFAIEQKLDRTYPSNAAKNEMFNPFEGMLKFFRITKDNKIDNVDAINNSFVLKSKKEDFLFFPSQPMLTLIDNIKKYETINLAFAQFLNQWNQFPNYILSFLSNWERIEADQKTGLLLSFAMKVDSFNHAMQEVKAKLGEEKSKNSQSGHVEDNVIDGVKTKNAQFFDIKKSIVNAKNIIDDLNNAIIDGIILIEQNIFEKKESANERNIIIEMKENNIIQSYDFARYKGFAEGLSLIITSWNVLLKDSAQLHRDQKTFSQCNVTDALNSEKNALKELISLTSRSLLQLSQSPGCIELAHNQKHLVIFLENCSTPFEKSIASFLIQKGSLNLLAKKHITNSFKTTNFEAQASSKCPEEIQLWKNMLSHFLNADGQTYRVPESPQFASFLADIDLRQLGVVTGLSDLVAAENSWSEKLNNFCSNLSKSYAELNGMYLQIAGGKFSPQAQVLTLIYVVLNEHSKLTLEFEVISKAYVEYRKSLVHFSKNPFSGLQSFHSVEIESLAMQQIRAKAEIIKSSDAILDAVAGEGIETNKINGAIDLIEQKIEGITSAESGKIKKNIQKIRGTLTALDILPNNIERNYSDFYIADAQIKIRNATNLMLGFPDEINNVQKIMDDLNFTVIQALYLHGEKLNQEQQNNVGQAANRLLPILPSKPCPLPASPNQEPNIQEKSLKEEVNSRKSVNNNSRDKLFDKPVHVNNSSNNILNIQQENPGKEEGKLEEEKNAQVPINSVQNIVKFFNNMPAMGVSKSGTKPGYSPIK